MGQIYDAVKGLITPKMVSTAAETLGENEANVKSAVAIILPALLGRMIKAGVSPAVIGIVDDSGKDKLINHLPQVFEGHGIIDGKNYGERMENALIGSQNSEFPAAIAAKRGIKAENADRLTNWVSAVVAGYFGEQVVGKKMKLVTLLQDLEKEKGALAADIPNDMYAKLGLSGLFGTTMNANTTSKTTPRKEKKGMGWIWWVIILLLLLLLLFFGWRSCERKNAQKEVTPTTVVTPARDTARNTATQQQREEMEYTLPNGEKIMVYKNGTAQTVGDFLKSDRYKNASANDLKGMWFEFDNIDFVFNSPNELEAGSMKPLNNLIAVLKNYPNAKMKIGGYADKTGTQVVNMEISKQRAEYIKSLFISGGIDPKMISTQGFGEEFATVPANATNAQRAIDRSIALRFDK